MNSRRLIGDAPRLFRVSLSRFRLGGNRLIAGVFAAPQESAPGPTRKEGVGVNHWRLTVYQRTCRGLGSPPGLGVGDERSGPLRSAPQVHVVPLPAPRPRARKEIIVPGGHNSSPRRLNHALVLAIARAKSWMRELRSGTYADTTEIARQSQLNDAHVRRVCGSAIWRLCQAAPL